MMTVTEGTDDPEVRLLARDLRQSVSTFVRVTRQDTGTVRSARSEALDMLHRLGPMNVAALAMKRGVAHQTMRLVMAQLEAEGLVRQEPDPADRRSRLMSISPEGRDALLRDQDVRASWIERAITERLSSGERDLLRAAITILDRLASLPTCGTKPVQAVTSACIEGAGRQDGRE
jgi:DNA-binding MarR family transcriptional regulator